MKLNRNNYEEYFILYLDNELDSEGRREVEAFAKQNPDLKAELDMLMQSKLTPDADISFTDKGALMRFDSSSISLSNYEEWLTAYIDNELTDGERRDVEVFVAGNPAIQRELNLLQQTKLQPETIVFPNKESLYRREEKARVISVRWWRIAAAAVLFLGIGTTTIILMNNQKKNGPVSPTALHPEVKSKSNETVKQPEKGTQSIPEVAVVGEKKNDSNKTDEPKMVVARIKQEDNKQDQKKESNYPAIAIITKDDKSPDKSTQSGNNVTTTTKPENNDAIAKSGSDALTIDKVNSKDKVVTIDTNDSSNNTDVAVNKKITPEAQFASETDGGSNKGIRGFLRKVTRTIEKRTNIKATDDDDRLLVAGLAIKL